MQVLGTAVLIKPDKLPERTETGTLIIPENSTEMLPEWGTIVDLGSECKVLKKGEHIHFNRRIASLIVLDGVDYYLINEHRMFISIKLNKEKV
jgi:co-chaperonin GroES (HSP10)